MEVTPDPNKPWTADMLDAVTRKALKEGLIPALSQELNIWCKYHPKAGLNISRAYESDVVKMTCSSCGVFVIALKIAQE